MTTHLSHPTTTNEEAKPLDIHSAMVTGVVFEGGTFMIVEGYDCCIDLPKYREALTKDDKVLLTNIAKDLVETATAFSQWISEELQQ